MSDYTDSGIDIEQPQSPVAISVDKMINELPPISPYCSIYRVPPQVRNLNERVYKPQVVAIGPFHHEDSKLKSMEKHKLRYMKAFLQRRNLSTKDCENVIKNRENEIRSSYAETLDLTPHELLKIVLVDGCFVVEAIISYLEPTFQRKVYLPSSNFLYDTDLMLLENQLPFFVLDDLYHLAFPNHDETQFLELCIRYFFNQMLIQVDGEKLITKVKDRLAASRHKIHHFVDLLRVCHLPSNTRQLWDETEYEKTEVVTIPNVSQVCEALIELKKSSSIFALDIQYSHKPHAVLEIPGVVVDEGAEYLLSNILVLEMCHYPHDSYIRDYVFFMDMLINTPKDVDLLIEKGIITTWTGDSSTVAKLFNNVGYNFPLDVSNYYFCSVSRKLVAYFSVTRNKWRATRHKWKAIFKRDYCSTPWRIASTTAAVILLVLTFIQTVLTIIQNVKILPVGF